MASIYSVVYLKIPNDSLLTIQTDINNNFNDICEKNIFEEIHNFFTKPHKLIEYHRYLFIGNFNLLDAKLSTIFKNIEQTQTISQQNNSILIHLYGDDFVNQLNNFLNNKNNEIIHFVPYSILPDDNVKSLYDIISISIPNIINNYIYLFADRSNILPQSFEFDIKHRILQAATLYRDKTRKGTFNMDDLKYILWSFGIPYSVIEKIISSKYATISITEPNNILQFLDDDIMLTWLKINQTYTTPTYHVTHYNNELLYPILSSPFLYFNSDKNPYYYDDITDKKNYFNVNKKGNELTIIDIISPKNNTFYIYSAADFKTLMNDTNYVHSFLKLFPSIKKEFTSDYSNITKNISDKYTIYNNVASSVMFFNNDDNLVKIINDEPLYLELHHRIYNNNKIDLLGIFNNIIPSKMMPLIIFKDPQIKEYIYKLFRPITEKMSTSDLEYPVSENELNKWINYTSYITENGIIKDIKDVVRGIQIKLLWKTAILNYVSKSGSIIDIYVNNNQSDKTKHHEYLCSIIYNELIIRDIPFNRKFITNFNENLKVNDNVIFYEPRKTYIDISLDANGHIYIKCPWKHNHVYDNEYPDILLIIKQWLNDMVPLFNNYLERLYLTPSLLNNMYDDDALNIDRFNTYSRYLNGSTYIQQFDYNYMIKMPSSLKINYDKFIQVLRLLQSIFVINEPILNKNDLIDYYDTKKGSWDLGWRVSEYNIDSDTYKISKASKSVNDIRRNLLRISSKKDGKNIERVNEIRFTYKKVSDFNSLNTIQQFILRLIQSNTPEIEIIENIHKEFKLDKDDAERQYKKYSNRDSTENIKLLTYLKFDTGIDIAIDYINSVNLDDDTMVGYNIFIKNVHSIEELKNINKLVQYIVHIYIFNNDINYHSSMDSIYIKYIKDYLIRETGIITEEKQAEPLELSSDADNIMMQDDINYDDIADLEDDYDELNTSEIKEAEVIDDGDGSRGEKEEIKEQKEPTKISARKSTILEILKKRDVALFEWRTKTGKIYSRACQSDKQPVVLTDAEKIAVDRDHPGSYTIDSNLNCDIRDPAFMSVLKNTKGEVKCAALRHGSSSDIQNWYICPRIYDAYDRVPLNISDLTFDIPGFEQKDNSTGWRTDKNTLTDILDFGPSYKGRRQVIQKNKSLDITEKNSLIFKDSKFTPYPGLAYPVDPDDIEKGSITQKIYPPCCVLVHSDGVRNLFTGYTEDKRQHGEYVLQWGKELADGRYGYLNEYLNECLGYKKCAINKIKCLKRLGVKKGNFGFLNAIAHISGINKLNDLLTHIISKLNENIFIRLNRGLLHNDFKTIGYISELQNFIEYTLSNEYKLIEHYYDLVTRPMGFPKCPNGFNLLIIEYELNVKTNTYSYNIVVPYYTSFRSVEKIEKLPTAIILKNMNFDTYEIVDFGNNLLFERSKFPNIDAMVDKVWYLILRNKPKNNYAPSNKKLKQLLINDSVLYFDDAYNYISKNYKKHVCVYDGYQIIGIYIYDNKLLVPVYPTDYPDNLDICVEKILLTTLIDNRNEMLLSLDDFNKNIELFMNIFNKKISIRFVYNDNNNTVGIMTSYAVYIPVKDSPIIGLPNKTNIFKIIKNMNITEDIENKNVYLEPVDYKKVIDRIKTYPNYKYKLVKRSDLFIGLLLINYASLSINIFYPIKHISKIEDNSEIVILDDNMNIELSTGTTMDVYMKNVNFLYNKDKSIPIRPIRLYMDPKTRKFNGFLLETGDIIKFDNKYAISLDNKLSSDDLEKLLKYVNNIVMNSLSDKLANMSLNRDKPLYIDERVIANSNIEYQLEIYDYIIKNFNKFLKNDANDKYRQLFINILTNKSFTLQQKMRIVRPLYIAIMSILFSIGDNDDFTKCQNKIITLPNIDNIVDYIVNIYSMKLGYNDDINKILNDKFMLNSPTELYNMYKNTNNDDIDYIQNDVIDIYKQLYNNYNNNTSCVTIIDNEIVNANNLVERLFNDFVKNKIIQDMIINEYSKIEYTDRYIQHGDDEFIFRSGEGIQMWNRVKLLYDKKLKLYFQNLTSLNNIKYDREFTIGLNEASKLQKNNIYITKDEAELDTSFIDEIENNRLADEQAKRLAEEQAKIVIKETPMYLMDILKSYGIVDMKCITLIFAAFHSKLKLTNKYDPLIDDKVNFENLKNEIMMNRLVNIDLIKLKEALNVIVNNVMTKMFCPKLNIIFSIYDGTYISYNKDVITNEMKENKWIIIKVINNNNIISFVKVENEYKYNEIIELVE
jgi:hypothetical protein